LRFTRNPVVLGHARSIPSPEQLLRWTESLPPISSLNPGSFPPVFDRVLRPRRSIHVPDLLNSFVFVSSNPPLSPLR